MTCVILCMQDDLRGRTLPDSGERAYALSKSYMLMANRELARRLEGTGVDVIAGEAAPPTMDSPLLEKGSSYMLTQPAEQSHSGRRPTGPTDNACIFSLPLAEGLRGNDC